MSFERRVKKSMISNFIFDSDVKEKSLTRMNEVESGGAAIERIFNLNACTRDFGVYYI